MYEYWKALIDNMRKNEREGRFHGPGFGDYLDKNLTMIEANADDHCEIKSLEICRSKIVPRFAPNETSYRTNFCSFNLTFNDYAGRGCPAIAYHRTDVHELPNQANKEKCQNWDCKTFNLGGKGITMMQGWVDVHRNPTNYKMEILGDELFKTKETIWTMWPTQPKHLKNRWSENEELPQGKWTYVPRGTQIIGIRYSPTLRYLGFNLLGEEPRKDAQIRIDN